MQRTGGTTTGVTGFRLVLEEQDSGGASLAFDPSSDFTSTTQTLISKTRTLTNASTAQLISYPYLQVTVGVAVDVTFKIKGWQFERAAARTAYQFNYANTNIAQPPFAQVGALLFDGVDDFMQTPSIDFSATDKMTVFAGVRKLSDAAIRIVTELTANLNVNNGAFYVTAPQNAGTGNTGFSSKGTVEAVASFSSFLSPATAVLTGIGDISGDISTQRRNGVQVAQATTDQGTGNYANAPIYIGRRGGASLPFNGYLHSLIVRGAATSATDITATETWVNSKTGAY